MHPSPSMLDTIVRYLQRQGAAFRLFSYASPEPLPAVAHAIPVRGQLVDTKVVLAGGAPVLACVPVGTSIQVPLLARVLGTSVLEVTPADDAYPFPELPAPIPPLGGVLGVPTVVDERVAPAVLVFRAFSLNDYVEIIYDDFERVERPRVESFAIAGELAQASAL